MAIGLGIMLLLIGLVLVLDVVQYDIPRVADEQLGTLLVVLGLAAVVISLIYSAVVSRRSRVEEHHYQEPPRHHG